MDGRVEALDREAAKWGRRVDEQRRLVAELMPHRSLGCKIEHLGRGRRR
jgi:hypothetical protein